MTTDRGSTVAGTSAAGEIADPATAGAARQEAGRADGKTKQSSDAIKTYRYLRIAMVMLLAGIGVSVLVEITQVGGRCLQGSISAYYYTPVRAFFVSAVLALGVCMVAIRGVGWWEETALNLAGMLAPVVALVPTPGTGSCTSDPSLTAAGPEAVGNNMAALLWMAPLGALYVVVLRILAKRRGKTLAAPQVGLLIPVAVLWFVALVLFWFDRGWVLDFGHGVSALLMFACIVAVVALNGVSLGRKEISEGKSSGAMAYANRYSLIAAAMVLSFLVTYGWHRLSGGWGHWVFAVEALLLGLFLLFWTLQTEELWDEAVREGDPQAGKARAPDGRLVTPWAAAGSSNRGT